MKAVILAVAWEQDGEETVIKPKPMIEIGGMPIIWHIMKIYSCYGINDFIICCGYKGYLIKEYFMNYSLHTSDVEIDLSSNSIQVINKTHEDWSTLVDTGEDSMTGGRLKGLKIILIMRTFVLLMVMGSQILMSKNLLIFIKITENLPH